MQYRYFACSFDEVVKQFRDNYGDSVLTAQTQKEFEQCLMNKKYYKAIILDTFLFFDILTEDNIYHVKSLEKYFDYIVFVGKDITELSIRIKKLK